MPLQKIPIPISFVQGVDTKSDQKQVVVGKLLQLENATLISPGQLQKAPGYVALTQRILGNLTSQISSGQALASLNGELVMASNNTLYSFGAAPNSWVSKGPLLSVNVNSYEIDRGPYNDTGCDGAVYTNGLAAWAWEETYGGNSYVKYSVMDTGTQQFLVSSAQVPSVGGSAYGSKPKVVAFGVALYIIWVDATNAVISALPIPVNNPQQTGAVVTLCTDLTTGHPTYDVCLDITDPPQPGYPPASTLYVAYNQNGGSTIGLTQMTIGNVVTNSLISVTGATAAGGIAITPAVPGTNQTAVPYFAIVYGTASDVRGLVVDNTATIVTVDTELDTIAPINVAASFVAGQPITGGITGTVTAFYTYQGSPNYNSYISSNTLTVGAVAGTAAVLKRSLSIASKAFIYQDTPYFLANYESGTGIQNMYFLLDSSGNVWAKVLANGAGGLNTNQLLSNVWQVDDTTFSFTCLVQDLLVSNVSVASQATQLAQSKSSLYSQTGVQAVEINFFDKGVSYARAELANTLHFTGGYLAMYDGAHVVEHGFHLWPEQLSIATGGSGSVVYSYIGVYEWTDAQGNKHQSAPSLAVQTSGGAAITTMLHYTVTFPTLRVTQKEGVVLAVYRTENNGSQYYRVTDVGAPTLNDPNADSVTITDNVPDQNLVKGQDIYTFGGVVENVAPPACQDVVTTFSNRLWVLSSENKLQIWYSKNVIPGVPAQFSDLFTFNMDPRGGDVTAMSAMDAYQVVYKAQNIFVIAGNGPDSTGQQNDFQPPQLIATDAGCTDPRSIVLTPMGLMYKSQKGIYLLGRDLSNKYIGADVEAYNNYAVVSANLVANTNQVRFNLENGTQLIYDYFMGQWYTRPLFGLVDAAIREAQYFYLEEEGRVLAEDPNSYAIAGHAYSMKVVTSWLKPAGIAGLSRIYGLMLTGDWKSPHQLRISIAYDYNPNPTQVVVINAEQFDPGYWGDPTTWGSDPVWGNYYPSYQFRVNFAKQKCTAVQITIEDNQVGVLNLLGQPASPGPCYNLSNLTFIAGVKEGWKKVGIERVFG